MTENNELIRSSAATLARKLAAREVSAVEVTQAHLDRIAAVDGKVHAFLHVNTVGSSRVDLQACKLEYSIVSPK